MKIREIEEATKNKWMVYIDLRDVNTNTVYMYPVVITAKNPAGAKKKAQRFLKAGKLNVSKDIMMQLLTGKYKLDFIKVRPVN